MKKFFLTLFLLFLSSHKTLASQTVNVQVVPYATLNSARFQLNQDATASFSGLSYGGYIAAKLGKRGSYKDKYYGMALLGGVEAMSLDNAANTANEYETLEGTVINFGARFYALDLYLGVGVLYTSATDTYIGNPSVTTNYKGLGVRLETGFDVNLTQALIATPRIHYDISDYSPQTSVGTKQRFKNFGISVGLGLEF